MISSRVEAMSLLNNWKSQLRLIQVVFDGASGVGFGPTMVSTFGFVSDVSDTVLKISVGMSPITLELELPSGTRFDIGDASQAPELKSKYDSVLVITLASAKCIVAALSLEISRPTHAV